MNPTARIAKNSLVQILAGVVNKILGVVLIIVAARQLGLDGFGCFSFVLSMYAMFFIVTDFGSVPATIDIIGFQMSVQVGRGFSREDNLTVG